MMEVFNLHISEENRNFLLTEEPKIAIVAPTLDTVPSRFGNAIYDLIESIAKHSKYPILIISRYFADLPASEVANQIVYLQYERDLNYFEKNVGYRGRKYIWGVDRLFDIYYLKKVLKFLSSTSVQIVMTEDNTSFFPAISSKWKKRFKFLHHQHAGSLFSMSRFFGKIYLSKIENVIFVSRATMVEAKNKHSLFSSKFLTIYNGIELENFPMPKYRDMDESVLRLLYVGRIVPGKGVVELLRAVAGLGVGQIMLKVVGSLNKNIDHGSLTFSKEIADVALSNRYVIKLVGHVSQKYIHELYAWADFVVVPSVSKEGLPKVVFESLVMGRPIIASNRGGVREVVEHLKNGVLINDPVDPENIKKAIEVAYNNRSAIQEYTFRKILEYRNMFSSRQMANKFDALFEAYLP